MKPADAALSATPAMLLSGDGDVRENFKLDAGRHSATASTGCCVEPQPAEADFRSALFGFAERRPAAHDRSRTGSARRATSNFRRVAAQCDGDAEEVSFTPPAGADVIGTPVK